MNKFETPQEGELTESEEVKILREAELAEQARLQAEAMTSGKPAEGNAGENSDKSVAENSVDSRPIEERIGHPQTEMFKKYGEVMRQTVDKLFDAVKQRDSKHKEVLVAGGPTGGGPTKRPDLWKEYLELDDKVRQLREDALCGNKVFRDATDYDTRQMYMETVMSDPNMVLRFAESGQLGYYDNDFWNKMEGIGKVSEGLRGNAEFAKKVLDVIPQDQAKFFWSHITGEARESKNLYIAAVAKNRANFQFGADEWKKDPEIQQLALAGGLAPESLKVIMDRVEERAWRAKNAR